ncbi:J domain-containing protein [Lawsonia intracellularis]|uniref:DnaJ-class molecular chaperone n=1 Tax=Lawsonia intracellularis (strain PHE/MN1-00) TaxID=363253 RepID=Q1MRK4_LAWIP|nr:J domain-containing protein [Lawsonia intracellularis]AGC49728.1 DnaJ-class molecular chaperone [Lawsonia intracellularis N343]KAA0205235.1 J domain-containing protein [Lawsonia intracellularis]MBZ3892236.1 J domain-containing protein [Lawsonia intracellularis]RBN32218.1 J domain-containing protein [Lawsonia intracellularis]RBN33786.1 J domain-containing protein [Lawsonia intracellularis]
MILDKYYKILHVDNSAFLDDIKRSYRKLAFALHPDLNPTIPHATAKFQQLNEAYVILLRAYKSNTSKSHSKTTTKQSTTNATQQKNKERDKAYRKNKTEYIKSTSKKTHSKNPHKNSIFEASIDENFDEKQKILQDILNDDFARNVFEDIFRTIQNKQTKSSNIQDSSTQNSSQNKKPSIITRLFQTIGQITHSFQKGQHPNTSSPNNVKVTYGGKDAPNTVKSWLKSQIDEEQTIELPATALRPGSRIRLNIRQGFSEKLKVLDLTLPSDFTFNKQLYFKGMGKKLGRWQGDLYLRFIPKRS